MSDPRHYKRGEVVWSDQVEAWHEILAVPVVKRGVVTGAGQYQMHVTWDGDSRRENFSQGAVFHDTRLEALQAAMRSLEAIYGAAIRRADETTAAIQRCQEMLDAEEARVVVEDDGPDPEGYASGFGFPAGGRR